MSETTNISWATSTGNPWIGCTKVSPGCAHCYAATLDENKFSRTMGGGTKEKPESHWGKGAPRVRTKAFWTDAVKWDRETARAEFVNEANSQSYRRPRIFPSLCDWLDDEVPIEWLADFLKLIHGTPNLDWLLLTKRPENFHRVDQAEDLLGDEAAEMVHAWATHGRPPENVWLGVSVEDQKRADERIPLLLSIPAAVRFLSVEPLLEGVNLRCALHCDGCGYTPKDKAFMLDHGHCKNPTPIIDWCIIGGESGPGRRDCGVDAIVDVANQCKSAGVACFVKQDVAAKSGQQGRIPEATWALKQFPKHRR